VRDAELILPDHDAAVAFGPSPETANAEI